MMRSLRTLPALVILVLFTAQCVPGAPQATATPRATPAFAGDLRLTKYLGDSTAFKIETARGAVIIVDPYLIPEDVAADIVTESHQHSDHADIRHITGNYALFNTPGQFDAAGVSIRGVPGHHNVGDTGVTNIIYVFDFDGLRLAQFASQGDVPTAEMFAQIGQVDIAILQVFTGAPDKLDPDEACAIIRQVGARIVILAHGDNSLTGKIAAMLPGGEGRMQHGPLAVDKAALANQAGPLILEMRP